MIKAKRLGHATFEHQDIERQVDYYQNVVGLSLVAREAGRAFLATEVGQLAIVIEQGREARCTRLAFEVAPDCDFKEASRALANRGIASTLRSDPVPGIARTLAFSDPKGTAIELFSRWEFLGNTGPVAGARPNKLGHIAFVTPDPKAVSEFYAGTLGFRVADWIEDWFVFMRCNADHHTVNFIRGPANRIHHLAFELRDSSHLNLANDILGRNRIALAWGPVRHGPGHNIAAYHRNAGGHLVEMFIDMDQMTDEELGYYQPRPWHRDRPQRPKVWSAPPDNTWGLPPLPEFTREVQ